MNGVRNAHSVRMMVCDNPLCTAVHMISCDEQDKAILNTALSASSLPQVIEWLQNHLYKLAVLKDGNT